MAPDSFLNTAKRGFMSIPIAIRTLIAINTIVFFVQIICYNILGIDLAIYLGMVSDGTTTITEPWRLVTYMFLHSMTGPFHYIFNMLMLWWFGNPVEQHLGPQRFLTIYFGAGFMGAFVDIVFTLFGIPSLVIGASGAIYGVMVAFAMIFPRMPVSLILLPPIEARFLIAGFIALNVLFLGHGDNVARLVHLGGALGGYLLMKAHKKGTDLSLIPRYIEYLFKKFKPSSTSKSKTRNKNMSIVSDAEIVEEVEQSELDAILDKISKGGYEALSKEEKKKLHDLSKKN